MFVKKYLLKMKGENPDKGETCVNICWKFLHEFKNAKLRFFLTFSNIKISKL
jgi:hypothetical protein